MLTCLWRLIAFCIKLPISFNNDRYPLYFLCNCDGVLDIVIFILQLIENMNVNHIHVNFVAI